MAETRRFYWLKLKDDFFQSKRIKKLRSLAGGDTFTIIYLKMQLLSISKGGFLEFTGLEKNFAEELALDIDENPDNVEITIQYLMQTGLLETSNEKDYLLPYAVENIGSEGLSAQRVREFREREKCKALQCNDDVTQVKRLGNVDIDNREKIIDIDKEKSIEKKSSRFTPPTLEQVEEYCKERNNNVDAKQFINHYESNGWKIGGKGAMKDWKAAVRYWEGNEYNSKPTQKNKEVGFDLDDFFEAATKKG